MNKEYENNELQIKENSKISPSPSCALAQVLFPLEITVSAKLSRLEDPFAVILFSFISEKSCFIHKQQ
jgi:hypothetical protein